MNLEKIIEKYKNRQRKDNTNFLAIVSIVSILILTIAGISLNTNNNKKGNEQKEEKVENQIKHKINIIDKDSLSKPIMVSIHNEAGGLPHVGLQDAYIIYEVIVEGGETRLLALFKDKNTKEIGPVRSARHYFLDYAMENDAIFLYHGKSPQVERDLKIYNVDNINTEYYDGSTVWRSKDKNAPHNAFTNIENILKRSEKLNINNETIKKPLLDYSSDEIYLKEKEDSIVANEVIIPYSKIHSTKYVYDEELMVYKRFYRNREDSDKLTGEQYTTKNIIIINVKNYPDPYNSDLGRQTLTNVTSGKGYYITNGYAIPITFEKEFRDTQTIYKYLNGDIIKINDGNTYIQIQPIEYKVTFK